MFLLTHQDEISNQIRLSQFESSGVQAFEDQLWVVLTPQQHDLNRNQFFGPREKLLKVRFGHLILKERKVFRNSFRRKLELFSPI